MCGFFDIVGDKEKIGYFARIFQGKIVDESEDGLILDIPKGVLDCLVMFYFRVWGLRFRGSRAQNMLEEYKRNYWREYNEN